MIQSVREKRSNRWYQKYTTFRIKSVLTKPRSLCSAQMSKITMFSPTHPTVQTLPHATSDCSRYWKQRLTGRAEVFTHKESIKSTDGNACDFTRGCTDTVRESALKGDSGRKIPCRTGKSNLRGRRTGPMLYQLSYIPTPFRRSESFWWIRLFCPVLQPNCGQKWYAARSFGSPHINSAGRQWWKERIKMRSTENTSWCKSVTFIYSAFAGS